MPDRVDGSVRRLAAIWFADIVGYTRMSSKDENTALRLVGILQNAAREECAAHGGRIVKFIGDAVLADFTSSDSALRAALSLRDRFTAESAEAGAASRLRIGVHVGDVLGTPDGDLYGDGINTASRVQGAAEPGQVCVTQDVWNQLRQRTDFRFDSLGERQLKGLDGRVWMFSASMGGAGEPQPAPVPALPEHRSARYARVVRVALVYAVVSAILLQLTGMVSNKLGLPVWVTPAGFGLLLVGFIVTVATEWVQTRPAWKRRVGEPADPWKVDVEDLRSAVAGRRLPTLTWGRALAGGALAFSLLFGAAGVYVIVRDVELSDFTPQPAAAQPGLGLAILPFDAGGSDEPLWEEGMPDLLALNLDGAAGLRVIDPRLVIGHWREVGGVADSTAAIRLARQVGARYAVLGRTLATGDLITISAQVFDTGTGELLGAPSVSGTPDSLPQLMDRLGLEILRAGVVSADAVPTSLDIGRLATASVPALRAYLEGSRELRRSRWSEAAGWFAQAVEADSTFAQAHYRMALAASWADAPHEPRRDGHAEAALRHAGNLSPRDAMLVQGYDELSRRAPGAARTLEALTSTHPDDVEGWFLLGDAYFHAQDGRFREALERAVELDASFAPAYFHLIEDAARQGDRERALRLSSALSAAAPGSPLLSTVALLLQPTPADPGGAPAVASPSSNPAEAAYESSRRAADLARSAAAAAGAAAQRAFARGDSLRGVALADAAQGRFDPARRQMDAAKDQYDAATSDVAQQGRVDAERRVVESLQSGARLSGSQAGEVQALRRQADDAEAAGRYDEAIRLLRAVAERYRTAAATTAESAPAPARPGPTGAQPPAAETRPSPGASADQIAAEVIEEMRLAMEREDLAALRAVWTLSAQQIEGFQTFFRLMRDLRVSVETLSVTSAGDRISVRIRQTSEGFNESTRRQERQVSPEETLQLGQVDGRWVILSREM